MFQTPLTLLIAGTRSGSGKTTLALCLMAALRQRHFRVQAFKAGPDFIDPGHHHAVTGRPSCNLDTWMAGEHGVRTAWARLLESQPPPQFLLGEGVMGLFDGAEGPGGAGSTAHLARLLQLPLLLVVDARGMGQSTAALAHGFTSLQTDLNFAGMVCTHVGGQAHKDMLREAFDDVFAQRIPLLGLLPREGAPELSSRHLGLIMAHEMTWDTRRLESMTQWVEEHMDVNTLLTRCVTRPSAQSAPSAPATPLLPSLSSTALSLAPLPSSTALPSRVRIGIAYDAAFCFLYAHMPAVLEELGAECVFFSPLRDTALPDNCHSLYFPGGYPELHAQRLASNTRLHDALRSFAASGRRVYGECGGYIFLMESVEVEGRIWPMSACLPLHCRLEKQRVALGYREVTPCSEQKGHSARGERGERGPQGIWGRGHEFHYARLLEEPTGAPLWHVHDRKGHPLPSEGLCHGSVFGSWVHLCPYGGRELLAHIFQLPKAEYFNAEMPSRISFHF